MTAASRIPRHHRRNAILFTYLRLLAKAGALALFRMSPPSRERLFGHTLHLLDYRAFVDVFCEIFVRRNYEFSAATSAPLIIDGGSNIGAPLCRRWMTQENADDSLQPISCQGGFWSKAVAKILRKIEGLDGMLVSVRIRE